MKNRTIHVKNTKVAIASRHDQDYIALTDMVKNFDGGSALIEQWLKNKDTVLFLGVWEQINNSGNYSGPRQMAAYKPLSRRRERGWGEGGGISALLIEAAPPSPPAPLPLAGEGREHPEQLPIPLLIPSNSRELNNEAGRNSFCLSANSITQMRSLLGNAALQQLAAPKAQ